MCVLYIIFNIIYNCILKILKVTLLLKFSQDVKYINEQMWANGGKHNQQVQLNVSIKILTVHYSTLCSEGPLSELSFEPTPLISPLHSTVPSFPIQQSPLWLRGPVSVRLSRTSHSHIKRMLLIKPEV